MRKLLDCLVQLHVSLTQYSNDSLLLLLLLLLLVQLHVSLTQYSNPLDDL